MKTILTRALALLCMVGTVGTAHAAAIAHDDASNAAYTDGWQTGDNGGTGWGGGWTLGVGPGVSAGFLVQSSTGNGDGDGNADGDINTGGRAWGIFANSFTIATATRPFSGDLSIGQTLRLDLDNGYIDDYGAGGRGRVGFRVGGAVDGNPLDGSFSFRFEGGFTTYSVNGTASSIGFTDEGLRLELTRDGANTWAFRVLELGSGTAHNFSGSFNAVDNDANIARLTLLNEFAGAGSDHDAFFNRIAIVPEPASALLLGLGAAGLLARRRARKPLA